jgi:hypothetical protein
MSTASVAWPTARVKNELESLGITTYGLVYLLPPGCSNLLV